MKLAHYTLVYNPSLITRKPVLFGGHPLLTHSPQRSLSCCDADLKEYSLRLRDKSTNLLRPHVLRFFHRNQTMGVAAYTSLCLTGILYAGSPAPLGLPVPPASPHAWQVHQSSWSLHWLEPSSIYEFHSSIRMSLLSYIFWVSGVFCCLIYCLSYKQSKEYCSFMPMWSVISL